MLAWLGGWLAGRFDGGDTLAGRALGAGVGGAFLLAAALAVVAGVRRAARLGRQDARRGVVEDISVVQARVVQLDVADGREPAFAFDIGEGKLLLLQGQWLLDPERYGAPPLVGDPDEGVENGLPPPHSFPSDAFTVTRLPTSGVVCGLRVQGAYVAPERVAVLPPDDDVFPEIRVFDGTLEELAAAIAAEERRRDTPRGDV